jgi:hypothetical protein
MPHEHEQFGCAPCISFPPVISLSAGEIVLDAERNQPTVFKRLPPTDLAGWLVERQIEAYPDLIGPPITVLSLTAQGAQFKKQGRCSW